MTTVRLASILGAETVGTPDPTEDYHEASRIWPGMVDPLVVGATRLEASHTMRISATRSVKRYPQRPFVELPAGTLGTSSLAEVLESRRSRREYADGTLDSSHVAVLLRASYGVTAQLHGTPQRFRAVPSGGALYPLELYVACLRVTGLDRALYHYDPLRDGLELLRPLTAEDGIGGLSPYPQLLTECAVFVVVTAMFWRSRFKYGPRSYRFALLETGHLAQNFLLAAEALGLAATPVGGFYDARADQFVGVDGLFESSLYLLPVGWRADT